MPLPDFNEQGDLPIGVHQASLQEVIDRFGQISPQRQLVTARLLRIFELAKSTQKLLRFVIFGSYVTAKVAPNDVDIVLIVTDDFDVSEQDEQIQLLFDHLRAQKIFCASIFAVRPSTTLMSSVDEFISGWQIKRDRTERGIVEIIWEEKDDSE